ncbi:hypothetical protein G5C51_04585 [Streptomyces sp. A7024]|uniref:TniQ domain-containing protein n=1 Tax=Streptomyces coryli TaxID=1128680 RepID=A0A6G4TT73_9ACTN|nr:TniQ family protein [Streptomyces coryli]NGN63185.1 hypothetical protein [Streptomyces coryli]
MTAPLAADDLALRVPLIHGETTGSYLTRTAAANGVPLPRLLAALTDGGLELPDDGLAPPREEVLLPTAAVEKLATLVHRSPGQLAEALPTTGGNGAVRLEAWPRTYGGPPLPACPLCMEPGAWLVANGYRWHPCGCGRRWLAGDDGGYLVDTGPVPELGRALTAHREMLHRLGPVADALVVDAHQIMLWWWVSGLFAPDVWRAREDALGLARRRRRAAPVVVYPEAVTFADTLWRWEERRRRKGVNADKWLTGVGRLAPAGPLARRELQPVRHWLRLHPAEPPVKVAGRSTPERRFNRLPELHHRPRPHEHGPMRAPSCLMWVYGLPLTATSEICPKCRGRNLSCQWVPYPECAGTRRKR